MDSTRAIRNCMGSALRDNATSMRRCSGEGTEAAVRVRSGAVRWKYAGPPANTLGERVGTQISRYCPGKTVFGKGGRKVDFVKELTSSVVRNRPSGENKPNARPRQGVAGCLPAVPSLR